MLIGIFLMVVAIIIIVVYEIYNNKHKRDANIFDMIVAQVVLAFCILGLQVLFDYRDRNDVHEIRCEQPAELKLGIDMVIDKDGNVQSDTVYIYKFNQEINHKHYAEK